jgi:hypothetical protein
MKTLGVLFGVWFAWVWLFPIALGLAIAAIYGVCYFFKWWWDNIQEMRKRKKESAPRMCIVYDCKEMACETLHVKIKFKEGDVLKEKWHRIVCKGCAGQLDGALLHTQWLTWTHLKTQDPKDTGWYETPVEDKWPPMPEAK